MNAWCWFSPEPGDSWREIRPFIGYPGPNSSSGADAAPCWQEVLASADRALRSAAALLRRRDELPKGYCGLPLQQTCPHPNACLTCDSFLTTAEFLPAHREQLTRTEQLIANAQAVGRHRLVEMNEPIRLNPLNIIDGLETLKEAAYGC